MLKLSMYKNAAIIITFLLSIWYVYELGYDNATVYKDLQIAKMVKKALEKQREIQNAMYAYAQSYERESLLKKNAYIKLNRKVRNYVKRKPAKSIKVDFVNDNNDQCIDDFGMSIIRDIASGKITSPSESFNKMPRGIASGKKRIERRNHVHVLALGGDISWM